MNTVMYFL